MCAINGLFAGVRVSPMSLIETKGRFCAIGRYVLRAAIEWSIGRGKSTFHRDQQLPNLENGNLIAGAMRTHAVKEPVSLPRPFTGLFQQARRRNIVINNPFWLVFVGAPDRCSSPLPLTDNLLSQTTCITVRGLRFFFSLIIAFILTVR